MAKSFMGVRLRSLREERGITQAALAQALKLSPSYVNQIESNQRPITVPVLLRLQAYFGIDLQFFSEDEESRVIAELREITAGAVGQGVVPLAELQAVAQQLPAFSRRAAGRASTRAERRGSRGHACGRQRRRPLRGRRRHARATARGGARVLLRAPQPHGRARRARRGDVRAPARRRARPRARGRGQPRRAARAPPAGRPRRAGALRGSRRPQPRADPPLRPRHARAAHLAGHRSRGSARSSWPSRSRC